MPRPSRSSPHLAAGGMRDAESMLDQVLSAGIAPITADAVRDLLGLADEQAIDAFVDAPRRLATSVGRHRRAGSARGRGSRPRLPSPSRWSPASGRCVVGRLGGAADGPEASPVELAEMARRTHRPRRQPQMAWRLPLAARAAPLPEHAADLAGRHRCHGLAERRRSHRRPTTIGRGGTSTCCRSGGRTRARRDAGPILEPPPGPIPDAAPAAAAVPVSDASSSASTPAGEESAAPGGSRTGPRGQLETERR